MSDNTRAYEERITLWRATSFEHAIARAEQEAAEYAVGGYEFIYTEYATAYHLSVDGTIGDGAEVYSIMRDSELEPDDYIGRFLDTGSEHQRTLD